MATSAAQLTVSELEITVRRKAIKNLHLGVYPPDGKVRVSAPQSMSDEAIRLAVVTRLGWIRSKQKGFNRQAREPQREYMSGETHFVQGRRFRLNVVEVGVVPKVSFGKSGWLDFKVPTGSTREQRERYFQNWQRRELRRLAEPLISDAAERLRVAVPEWGIRRMKTKWGSCNASAKRIWLNLELFKKPLDCLEYIIVHELVHLSVRHHNDEFHRRMDRYLPLWKNHRDELNRAPLAHENWTY